MDCRELFHRDNILYVLGVTNARMYLVESFTEVSSRAKGKECVLMPALPTLSLS